MYTGGGGAENKAGGTGRRGWRPTGRWGGGQRVGVVGPGTSPVGLAGGGDEGGGRPVDGGRAVVGRQGRLLGASTIGGAGREARPGRSEAAARRRGVARLARVWARLARGWRSAGWGGGAEDEAGGADKEAPTGWGTGGEGGGGGRRGVVLGSTEGQGRPGTWWGGRRWVVMGRCWGRQETSVEAWPAAPVMGRGVGARASVVAEQGKGVGGLAEGEAGLTRGGWVGMGAAWGGRSWR
nr:hypothetical protein [Tanacetum cinerariifolium]